MAAIALELTQALKQRLDVSPLIPDSLAGKTLAEISELQLQYGNRKVRVDSLFRVQGDNTDEIRLHGNEKIDFIGRGMRRGKIEVIGNVGAWAGMQMEGGCLRISGNTGAYAACEMKGGVLEVAGDAGDFLGAAQPGNLKGMANGLVIVKGNAGDRVGDHMRRGVILIEGNAGAYLGARMAAGTIAVMGNTGAYPGYAMKRGTLLLYKTPASLPVTFGDCGSHTLGFLPLLLRSFRGYETKFAESENGISRVQRYAGDAAVGGKGEILCVS